MALPTVGQLNWGPVLNGQISSDEAAAALVASSLTNHLNNSPADPHGDRAYAAALVAVITTGTNGPNGYVVLDGTGKIPVGLFPPGAFFTNIYDVKNSIYGAVGTGTVDDSTAINAAHAAAVTAGGGIVWIPDGLYGIGSAIVTGNGVTTLLSQGATIQRIAPVSAPTVMMKNYSPGVAAATGYMAVIGGKWDAVGTTNQNSTNTIFSFVNTGQVQIQNCTLNQTPNGNSPYGAFYGCMEVTVENVNMTGATPSVSRGSVLQPAWRIEQTSSANLSGLVAGDYTTGPGATGAMVNGACFLNVSMDSVTGSDGSGAFTGWLSLVASTGTVSSNTLYHQNIQITLCDATGFASTGISSLNWNPVVYTNNQIATGNSATRAWVSTPPTTVLWTADDVWHKLNPTLAGWSQRPVENPLEYRFLAQPPNSVQIFGQVTGTAIASDASTVLATLPAGYYSTVHPTAAWPVITTNRTSTSNDLPNIVVNESGQLQLRNCQGATIIQINLIYSIDGLAS